MPEIRQRILENMQKFSRAMIGAVLFLPVIGLILALSSVLTNPTLIAETSFLHQLGQMLGDTFWPLFGNLGLLFCVGISYGLAKDKKTEVALVSVMCFIMFLGANHSWLEHTHGLAEKINGEYYGTGQTQLLGFVVVDMGVFLGIILGCTIAWVHNKVSAIELPGAVDVRRRQADAGGDDAGGYLLRHRLYLDLALYDPRHLRPHRFYEKCRGRRGLRLWFL